MIKIDDFQTYLIGKEDLILSKMQWARDSGSDVQWKDIRNLLASGYDAPYVSSWVKKLGMEKFFEGLLSD